MGEFEGAMSQEIGTIKQLLEMLLIPLAPGVKLLLKGGVLSNKPLKPPRVECGLRALHELLASPLFAGRIYPFSCT